MLTTKSVGRRKGMQSDKSLNEHVPIQFEMESKTSLEIKYHQSKFIS